MMMLHELKLYNTECTDYKSKLRYANLHLIFKKKKVVRRFKKHYKNRILWELFHGSGFTGLRLHIYPGIILCELNPMPW